MRLCRAAPLKELPAGFCGEGTLLDGGCGRVACLECSGVLSRQRVAVSRPSRAGLMVGVA